LRAALGDRPQRHERGLAARDDACGPAAAALRERERSGDGGRHVGRHDAQIAVGIGLARVVDERVGVARREARHEPARAVADEDAVRAVRRAVRPEAIERVAHDAGAQHAHEPAAAARSKIAFCTVIIFRRPSMAPCAPSSLKDRSLHNARPLSSLLAAVRNVSCVVGSEGESGRASAVSCGATAHARRA
jgi:hypothetical protein